MEKTIVWILLMTPVAVVMWGAVKALVFAFNHLRPSRNVSDPLPVATSTQVEVNSKEFHPSLMAVREIGDGKGTVIIRHRERKHIVTTQLIIWAGKRRKKNDDSVYDLGFVQADGITDEIINRSVDDARQKLASLSKKRSVVKQADVQAESIACAAAESRSVVESQPAVLASATSAPTVVVEENGVQDAAIKMHRHPTVFRGVIMEAGVMPRSLSDKVINQFQIRYRTPEGIEDAVYGADLKRALESANVKDGDHVEILKIGRKTVEKGKAPMTLYQIAKLPALLVGAR